ncbi:hypothetical protein AAH991_38080 [Microbispora sp. ZYX-F-249]|uniref:Uncharacterized protein n=1 Tax=Microbispora maris TaxID=3144104 RepID=A0ABV0B4V6_9ACTN
MPARRARPELDALERAEKGKTTTATTTPWRVDADHEAWLPRPGGPLPRLSLRLEEIATTGTFDTNRYDSPSEARQAVLAGVAACG